MASVRLYKDMRLSVARDLLIHRFTEPLKALRMKYALLSDDVYDDLYESAERKQMRDLPEGWLPTVHRINVRFGNEHTYLAFDGDDSKWYGEIACVANAIGHDRHDRRVMAKHSSSTVASYEMDHPLTVAFQRLEQESEQLRSQASQAYRTALAVLEKSNTVGALVKRWPEVEPFVKKWMDEPPTLPAVVDAEVNKLFDLPVEEAA